MNNAVQKMEDEHHPPVVSQADAMISMIERASSNPNVDLDKLERLLEMQEKIMARNAKAAYAAAFADMQGAIPEIEERGKGHGNITYALWEDVNEKIRPVLAQHGFGLSFKTGRTSDKITVTGILSHREGHSEETTMELPADQSGSKNAVQAVGSSTSYGKRYVAMALLNLTSRLPVDRDDDGAAAGRGDAITADQATALRALIDETGTGADAFCKYFEISSVPELPSGKFDRAIKALEKKRGFA